MNKRRISLIAVITLVFALVAGMLSGCGSRSATDMSAAEVSASEEAVESVPVESTISAGGKAESSAEAQVEQPALEPYSLPLSTDDISFSLFIEGNNRITSQASTDGTSNTTEIAEYMNGLLGVTLEYVECDMMTSAEEFQLMIASGNLPDMIDDFDDRYSGGWAGGYEADLIIDLTEVIENMPYYTAILDTNPDYRKLTSNDDSVPLAIASFCEENFVTRGGTIRQDWLDALSLDMPETYDDMTEVATAFKNEYGCSAAIYLTQDYNPMLNFSGGFDLPGFSFVETGSSFYQRDGAVQCAYTQDSFRDMIALITAWYNDGLISPDFFTMRGGGDAQQMVNSGEVGICYSMAQSITDYNLQLGDTGFKMAGMPNMLAEKGQTTHFSLADPNIVSSISVTSACENLDLLAAFLDWGFTEEGILCGNYGMEGISYEINDDGEPEFLEAMFGSDPGWDVSAAKNIRKGLPTLLDVDCAYDGIYDELGYEAILLWNSNTDGLYDLPANLTMSEDEREAYAAKVTDIETYVAEWVMQATTGAHNLEADWDDYLDTLYSLGLQDCLDIKQASYDRYLAK